MFCSMTAEPSIWIDDRCDAGFGVERQLTSLPFTVEAASDAELLCRYRDHCDSSAFNELVRRYAGGLFRHLKGYLNDRVPAEDVLQNTFLQVHLKCGLYRDGCPVRPWLYAIATNQAIDALRKVKRVKVYALDALYGDGETDVLSLAVSLADESPAPSAALETEERRRWVRESLSSLPQQSREIVHLAYFQGLNYNQIADALHIPLGTVKSRLHGAIARLREKAAG